MTRGFTKKRIGRRIGSPEQDGMVVQLESWHAEEDAPGRPPTVALSFTSLIGGSVGAWLHEWCSPRDCRRVAGMSPHKDIVANEILVDEDDLDSLIASCQLAKKRLATRTA